METPGLEENPIPPHVKAVILRYLEGPDASVFKLEQYLKGAGLTPEQLHADTEIQKAATRHIKSAIAQMEAVDDLSYVAPENRKPLMGAAKGVWQNIRTLIGLVKIP